MRDAAVVLGVIAGYDPSDDATAWSVGRQPDSYADCCTTGGLAGRRIGVLESFFGKDEVHEPVNEVIKASLQTFSSAGAELVSITHRIDSVELTSQASVHLDELKDLLDSYLAELPADARVHSLQEVMDSGLYSPSIEANMIKALGLSTSTPEYDHKLVEREKLRTSMMKLMADLELDAIIYPHQQQLVAKVGAGQKERNGVLCSITGFPSIAVPAGFSSPTSDAPLGVPVGLEIIGRPWSEPLLIELAYGFEQATHFRRPPLSTPEL